jgi:membrane-bound lytic murein transglycosylase D
VGPGDTLIGVARQFAVDVEDVAAANGLSATDELRAGSLLRLQVRGEVVKLRGDARSDEPAKSDDDAPKSKAPKGSTHDAAPKGKRHG